MHLLIVDDSGLITESLRNGIQWDSLGIARVFTANSAAEAKLLITNFEIDILLADIEMPEESGLDLVQWIRNSNYNICTIFLTSHADFSYAQRALRLGGFDYIMQPVRYSVVEKVVSKAVDEVKKSQKNKQFEQAWNELIDRGNVFLDAVLRQLSIREYDAARIIMKQLLSVWDIQYKYFFIHGIKICPLQSSESLLREKGNILSKYIADQLEESLPDTRFCVTYSISEGFYILLIGNNSVYNQNRFKIGINKLYKNLAETQKIKCLFYVSTRIEDITTADMKKLGNTFLKSEWEYDKDYGPVIWDFSEADEESGDSRNVVMEKAANYIQTHIGKNITRTEVADYVCLSEEYFSKLFKKSFGYSFKEFVINEKMKVAKSLLVNSELPISLIASKLGFVNFSHFSNTFKKNTNLTPQEYRKQHQVSK